MSKILLIGGAGFLGSALRRAFEHDARHSVFYSSTTGNEADPRHLVINLLDSTTLGAVRDFDIIVNLAGQVTEPMTQCFAINTTGLSNLVQSLDCMRQSVVQISTTQVYGAVHEVYETSPIQPGSPYATAKVEAEYLLRNRLLPTGILVIRLCNLYGAGQSKGLPWYLLRCIAQRTDVVIADNNGELKSHFLHVDDAAHIMHDLIATQARGIVNVAGEERYSIRELVAMCEKILGHPLRAQYGVDSVQGTIDVIRTDKLHALVPVHIRHSLEEYFREQLAGPDQNGKPGPRSVAAFRRP